MNLNLSSSVKLSLKEKIQIGAKLLFVIGACIFMIFNTMYGLANPSADIRCVYDSLFSITEPINIFFTKEAILKKSILILTSFLIDGMILSTLVHWCFYGNSFRFFFSFVILYVFHLIIRVTYFCNEI